MKYLRTVALVVACGIVAPAPVRAQGLEPQGGPEEVARQGPEPTAAPAPAADAAESASPESFHFELSARGAYTTPPVNGAVTPFGLGGGVGLDLVLSHVVLGGSVMAYFGGSDSVGSAESSVLYGPEVGYEFRLGPTLSLRPMFAFGGATITHTLPPSETPSAAALALSGPSARSRVSSPVDVVTQSSSIGGGGGASSIASSVSVTSLFLAPGIMATLTPSSGTIAGIGGRMLYLPSVSYGTDANARWLSYSLDLDLGLRF